jgi:hypothetical protein
MTLLSFIEARRILAKYSTFLPLEEWDLVLYLWLSFQSKPRLTFCDTMLASSISRVVVASTFGYGVYCFFMSVALLALFSLPFFIVLPSIQP